ncbi:CAAX prenyl protease-related protein [Geomonas sp. Red32]|uniref:CAAX prenyl protease-related protein n=1 Tax=Geomonas sp. Red32 TaxID=2912856 RepID=UPI00202D01BC|nr:CAAX prenyl protease-related protein [Geomonas sp. Red32]MCM0083350.1 CAAX prenyl protease-related protein [Geomonas sp. Red32]
MSEPATTAVSRRAMTTRVLPFALFMAGIAVEEGVRFASHWGGSGFPAGGGYYLYPLRAIPAGALLLWFLPEYHELRLDELRRLGRTAAVVGIGLALFVAWVLLDGRVGMGSAGAFDPAALPDGVVRFVLILSRAAGAVLVVPLMEEIFWRSFLIRFLVDPDFESVPAGRFNWQSFLGTVVLFGLEHHQVVAGMVAGAVYNALLYRTRSLALCVLAHATTNLALALYVVTTGSWQFW